MLWTPGEVLHVAKPAPASVGVTGAGLHVATSLHAAITNQSGPSRYLRVEPVQIIAQKGDQVRYAVVHAPGKK